MKLKQDQEPDPAQAVLTKTSLHLTLALPLQSLAVMLEEHGAQGDQARTGQEGGLMQ